MQKWHSGRMCDSQTKEMCNNSFAAGTIFIRDSMRHSERERNSQSTDSTHKAIECESVGCE